MTPQQIAVLEASANGTLSSSFSPGAPDNSQNQNNGYIETYPGCNQNGAVGATKYSRAIDSSKFNTDQCGLVSFYVDTTNTTIATARTLVLGGNIKTGAAQVATDIYGISLAAGGLIADLDVDDVVGVDSANFNPTDLMDFIQDVFSTRTFIFQRIDIERTSGTADLTSLGKFRKYSLSPEGDWEISNPKIQQNFCDPCLMDDGSRVSYKGFFPVSGLDAIALNIPIGVALTLEMCVFEYENAKNLTLCGA